MSKRNANLIICAVLMCIDAVFLYTAFNAREYKGAVVGPFGFSKFLGIVLAVLCTIIIIQSLMSKENSEKFVINNFDLAIVTVAATAILLILWQVFGHFYIWGFFYLLGLFAAYGSRSSKLTLKSTALYFGLSVVVIVIVYFLFSILMGINL